MALLLQAYVYALELGQDAWDLAVELSVLRTAKLTNSDLRWLVAKGYVEHAVEITARDSPTREFRRTPLLTFNETTCVVLTRTGVAAAHTAFGVDSTMATFTPQIALSSTLMPDELLCRPRWDHQRRQLRVGADIIKEFKLPSPNQETVLMAFEEESWPPRIDDPLPPLPHLDPRRRLHDTIKALNRRQRNSLMRFMGDGSGEGVRWEPHSPTE